MRLAPGRAFGLYITHSRNPPMEAPLPTPPHAVAIGPVTFANDRPFALISGPCQAEGVQHSLDIAGTLAETCRARGIGFVFKASFDKANRTSLGGKRGLGMEKGLDCLAEVRRQIGCPVLSDVHEAARTDGVYDPSERLRIDRVLATRYGLTAAQAAALRAQGELAQAEAVDLVRFTRAIKDAVPHAERIAVIEALWEVIYADGTREMYESALMRKLCGLLHVEDRDAGLARQRVAGRMGIE